MRAQTRTRKAEHPRRKGREHEHDEDPHQPGNPPRRAWPVPGSGSILAQSSANGPKMAGKHRTARPTAKPLVELAAVAATNARQRVQVDPTKACLVGIMKAHLGVESINPL